MVNFWKEEFALDRNKAFTIYALTLIAGVASVITASLMAGFATLPTPMVFVEHVALGLGIRAAYKYIGGFDLSDWTLTGEPIPAAIEAAEPMPAGATADATS
jgi:hypothetical protein